jgi:hypothetical protein
LIKYANWTGNGSAGRAWRQIHGGMPFFIILNKSAILGSMSRITQHLLECAKYRFFNVHFPGLSRGGSIDRYPPVIPPARKAG